MTIRETAVRTKRGIDFFLLALHVIAVVIVVLFIRTAISVRRALGDGRP